MRYFLLAFLLACVMVVGIAGFRGSISRKPPLELIPDMDRQPKVRPQTADSRLPVEGSVARGSHYLDIPENTGRETGTTNFITLAPVKFTEQTMARGENRYQIFCAPCHGAVGDGNGVIRKFGMATVANLHDRRIVEMGDGEIFHVITHGRNLMGPYGGNIVVEDRWAVVAYVRALQLARLGAETDLSNEQRAALK